MYLCNQNVVTVDVVYCFFCFLIQFCGQLYQNPAPVGNSFSLYPKKIIVEFLRKPQNTLCRLSIKESHNLLINTLPKLRSS